MDWRQARRSGFDDCWDAMVLLVLRCRLWLGEHAVYVISAVNLRLRATPWSLRPRRNPRGEQSMDPGLGSGICQNIDLENAAVAQ